MSMVGDVLPGPDIGQKFGHGLGVEQRSVASQTKLARVILLSRFQSIIHGQVENFPS